MRFVATEICFVNNSIVEAGQEFDHPFKPGSWCVPKGQYVAPEPEEPDEPEPNTLSAYQNRSALHGRPTGRPRGRPLGSKNKPT